MKNRLLSLLLILALSACGAPSSSGQAMTDCGAWLEAMQALPNRSDMPQSLATENPVKTGGEFDAMDYFTVFDHLSMEPGYALDYVYHWDGMGGYPVLYARPLDQTPYTTEAEMNMAEDQPSYLDFVRVDDTAEGYFQFTLLTMYARQFYLYWHANYSDTEIICNKKDLNKILASLGDNDFGLPMPLTSRVQAMFLHDLEPQVILGEESVQVRLLTFTKWGGIYLRTYSLARDKSTRILDMQEKNLVPYDCGIMF